MHMQHHTIPSIQVFTFIDFEAGKMPGVTFVYKHSIYPGHSSWISHVCFPYLIQTLKVFKTFSPSSFVEASLKDDVRSYCTIIF